MYTDGEEDDQVCGMNKNAQQRVLTLKWLQCT